MSLHLVSVSGLTACGKAHKGDLRSVWRRTDLSEHRTDESPTGVRLQRPELPHDVLRLRLHGDWRHIDRQTDLWAMPALRTSADADAGHVLPRNQVYFDGLLIICRSSVQQPRRQDVPDPRRERSTPLC